jgi:tetratricopeptide (TPR) repeat protein
VNADRAYELYRLGRIEFESGNLESAERMFSESLALEDHAKTAELLGECLTLQGRTSEALTALRTAVTLGKEARAPLLLAKALLLAGDKTGAESALRESLRRNPQYHPAERTLAELSNLAR